MSFINDKELTGKIISLVALGLAPLTTLLARHYSRSLYFAQLLFIVSSLSSTFTPAYTGTNTIISSFLHWSTLDFLPEFTSKINNMCVATQFACIYGKLVSSALSWLIGLVFFFILIKLVACKKREAKFLSFYNFYKGFMYWFFVPLLHAAVATLAPHIQAGTTSTASKDVSGSVIVIVGFIAIAIVELIAYKCAQREEENIWKKWIEFFTHICVGGTAACLGVYQSISGTQSALKYVIPYALLGIFALIYLIKYKFAFKVVERLLAIVQDGLIIATLCIFFFRYQYINTHHIDFYALVIVMAIEVFLTLVKLVMFCRNKNDDDEDAAVAPEKEGRGEDRVKRNNSFTDVNPEHSYNGLNNSGVGSPRRGGAPRRR